MKKNKRRFSDKVKVEVILFILAFFIALLAVGQAVVESDFGATGSTDFFTPSGCLIVVAIVFFVASEILARREEKGK